MPDDIVDLTLTDGSDVPKSTLRNILKNYTLLTVSGVDNVRGSDWSDRAGWIKVRATGIDYDIDLADGTTLDDGVQCLIDTASNRWKAINGAGSVTIDFGAFPGAGDASVAVSGLVGITAGATVEAWINVADSADHSADEHAVDPPQLAAGNVVAGDGFTIYGRAAASGDDVAGVWNVFYRWKNKGA